MGVTDCYVMNLTVYVHASPSDAILCNSQVTGSSTTISSLDMPGKEFSDLKNLKPLRKRGAGAAIGVLRKQGNHNFDELSVPDMHESENHSHRTPLGLIPQSPSGSRGFSVELMQFCKIFKIENSANLEAQGEV